MHWEFCPSINNGVSGGEGHLVKRRWTADTAHAQPPATATVKVMPCRKESVLESSRVKKADLGGFYSADLGGFHWADLGGSHWILKAECDRPARGMPASKI